MLVESSGQPTLETIFALTAAQLLEMAKLLDMLSSIKVNKN